MYSPTESENKDAECIFWNGKFSEDERAEISIKCFSYSQSGHLDFSGAEKVKYICDFYKYTRTDMVFA